MHSVTYPGYCLGHHHPCCCLGLDDNNLHLYKWPFFFLTLVVKALNGIIGEGILIPWRNALFADILAWRGLRIYESYSLTHLIHAIIISISRLLYLYFHKRDRLSISWVG